MSKAGCVIWLTGLPGSGKTTIADLLKEKLVKFGLPVQILDGDEIRKNISYDLGFSKADRDAHVTRVGYISHLLSKNGIITIVALISPYREIRNKVRSLVSNFIEVWVNCPLEICTQRDPKGLYKRASSGKLSNLTGVQDPYEAPLSPEVVLNTDKETPEESVSKILKKMIGSEYIDIAGEPHKTYSTLFK